MILGNNLGVGGDQMTEREVLFWLCVCVCVCVSTDVHDNLVIKGQSQEEKMSIVIFSTSAIASGVF